MNKGRSITSVAKTTHKVGTSASDRRAKALHSRALMMMFALLFLLTSCARMGSPDGGWYDETPPKVIGAMPEDRGINVKSNKIYIYFDEFIKLDNPTEKVVVSPPQLEAPEIKSQGKRIVVELQDSLKPNTTYTIDFSDAISDNNEDNPMGNFTYSFSTGEQIDTMEVAGYVLEAQNLEPIKGILVGLYSNLSDTIFRKEAMERVSRTDSKGHFEIKGVAPGKYRIYALQDADGNYVFNQKSEMIAFNHDIVVPSSKPDIRQDTVWRDSLHIDSIVRVPYTHFLPDDITLRAFTEVQSDRYLLKAERKEADHFTLYFSYGNAELPKIKGLNFNADNAFIIETNEKNDTISYWLRDTTLVNQDTLNIELQYLMTDTLGQLVTQTDTMEILSKQTYAKRMKKKQKEFEEWKKQQEKAEKRGEPFETEKKEEPLKVEINAPSQLDPDKNIFFSMPTPLVVADTSKIHLYAKHDSLWYRAPFEFEKYRGERQYILRGEWRPDVEYSLEIDSAAFKGIYGATSSAVKKGFKVQSLDTYSTLFLTISGTKGQNIVVQLLSNNDAVVKEVTTTSGTAEFFYVKPETYYVRMFIDRNGNGIWDTGNFDADVQPEEVFYRSEPIECKAKWDVTETWNPRLTPLNKQKPEKITKQKSEKAKTIKRRNAQRAEKLGIKYEPKSE